jgi:hypothetical protein
MQSLLFPIGVGNVAKLRRSRRPASVTIDVNRPGQPAEERLIPLGVYHAPSRGPASSAGMQRAAYSASLYRAYDWGRAGAAGWIDAKRAVLGGDFNVPINENSYPYLAFTSNFGEAGAQCLARAWAEGAGVPRRQVTANRTLVALKSGPFGNGAAIVTPNHADYRKQAIDNVFYRGFTPAQAPLPIPTSFDLPVAVSGGFANIPAVEVQAFAVTAAGAAATALATPPGGPPVVVPNMHSPIDTGAGLLLGTFAAASPATTSARLAAEFTRLFVSDHLPVEFQINL